MSERFLIWVFALTLVGCVLFAGEPDLVDALRSHIQGCGE